MYPSLDSPGQIQLAFKKQIPPSQAQLALYYRMTNSILELTKNFAIASFKPHLNYHECFLSLIINQKVSLPLRIVLLRNFPQNKPIVYITKWVQHPSINPMTCEYEYDNIFKWTPTSRLTDLVRKMQEQLSKNPPSQKNEIQSINYQFDEYLKQMESLRNRPNTQPPPPPQTHLQNVLKAFEYQDHLYTQCQQKNQLYLMTAQQYSQNVSRVRVISERFGKGKILKQLQNQLQKQVQEAEGGKFDDYLKKYYETRVKFHRIKTLKQLYLQN